jgi:flavodoxin
MKMRKYLVAYFSRNGSNYVSGDIAHLATGNTEVAAKMIVEMTGGDGFRIETANAYPENYGEMAEVAREELQHQARPEIVGRVGDIGAYEVVFLGYPNWWDTFPMAVGTFLEQHRMTGLTIAPFCTHEGTGMGRSEKDIGKLCPGANVAAGLAIHGTRAKGARKEIEEWVKRTVRA